MSLFFNALPFRLLPLVALMPTTFALANQPAQSESTPTTLPTTVVTASRIAQPIDQVIGDISVIERAELERYSGESVLSALQTQAGIQVISNGGAGKPSSVFIRGANAAHTLVLIDGVRYGSVTLGIPALEHLPIDQIERIEILRGSAASLYGSDAIGGVIQIFTRQGNKTPTVSVSIGAGSENTQQASLNASGQFGETRASVTVAHSKTDGINAVSSPLAFGYDPDDDGYQNSSIGLNVAHKLSGSVSFGLSGLLAEVENQYDGGLNTKALNDGYNGALNLWSILQINPNLRSEFKLGQSIDDSNTYSAANIYSYKTKQNIYQIQNTLNTESWGTMLLALERLEQQVESNQSFDQTEREIDSVLLGYNQQYEKISMQANLRNDNNSQYGNQNTYSIGISAALTDQISIGAQHSTGFLAPNLSSLYSPFGGNDQLQPEESKGHELFIGLNLDGLSSRLTVYRNDIKNLIQSNAPAYIPYNVGQARLQGVTLRNEWQLDQLLAGVNYDYLDAEDQSSAATRGKQLRYRAKHSGVAYFGMQQNQWNGRIELQAVDKRYTDLTNTQQVAGYTLVNLSGNVQLMPELKLGLRINNLFDEHYESIKDYGTLGVNGLVSLTYTPKL